MRSIQTYTLALVCLTVIGCTQPADDGIGLEPYPEPGSGLSEVVTDNPLSVQNESTYVTDQSLWGNLVFDRAEISIASGPQTDIDELAGLIENYHRHWLDRNDSELMRLFGNGGTRFRQGRVAYGIVNARAQIAGESRGERAAGHSTSMQLEIHNVRVDVDDEFASALYSVAVHGGARWEYADLATIQQVFSKVRGGWKLVGHTESTRLDDPNVPAVRDAVPNRRAPIRFDFAYPVDDLSRAIAFYAPLLGAPVATTSTRASFRLLDSYFELEVSPIDPRLTIANGFANGYATINVDSLADIVRRLSETGESHIELASCRNDQCMVTEDPSGNVIVWREPSVTESADAVRPTVSFSSGARPRAPIAVDVFLMMTAWMTNDLPSVLGRLTENAVWIDDAHSIAAGSAQIAQALRSRWQMLDVGVDGLNGDLVMSNVRTSELGNRVLVSFEASLDMRSNHRSSYKAFVTQVWVTDDVAPKLEQTFIARMRDERGVPVHMMNYTAYPVTNLGIAGRFYKIVLGSEPYRDNNWFGFWSTAGVFGLVGDIPEINSYSPIPHHGNGYANFSVRSIEEVYDYLRSRGAAFPLVEGINDVPGIDSQPGYRQILAVDSEGNLVNFSQYLEY